MIDVPPYVKEVLDRLEKAGAEAWCVGGCVRDALLGRTAADWDVCTSAPPQQAKAALGDIPTADTGLRHGTVTALTAGGPVEVTTFRREGAYSDHRRPDRVSFTTRLEEDLLRRDFTVNAMAFHPARGLRDPFEGQADLRAGLLRCVGSPARRFQEDALRILRCLRFAAVLGFSIEINTKNALAGFSYLLATVSPQRVQGELSRLLAGPWASRALGAFRPVLGALLPEAGPFFADPSGCCPAGPTGPQSTSYCIGPDFDALPAKAPVRWAALLWQAQPAQAEGLLSRLCFSNRDSRAVMGLLAHRGEPLPLPRQRAQQLLGALGPGAFSDWLALLAWAWPSCLAEVSQARALADSLLAGGACLSLKDLAISGRDLLGLGCPAGPALGQVLAALLGEVQAGCIPNQQGPLLRRAQALLRA